jgi:hypothetical protein
MPKLLAVLVIIFFVIFAAPARADTPEEWIALGARVHGGYGAFIPLGIRIGLHAVENIKAAPRGLSIVYYDNDKAPCACFADGIAIATRASFGQRTVKMAEEKAPPSALAVIVIRPRDGGPGLKYTIPFSAIQELGKFNRDLDPRGRHDAVMKADGLFTVEPVQ